MRNTPEYLTVGVEFFRRNAPRLLAKVEGGRAVVTLTNNGRLVARLVPLEHTERRLENEVMRQDPRCPLPSPRPATGPESEAAA